MENKPLCVKLRRFGGCVNWQSAYRNQYTLLSGCPASAREVMGSRSEQAPGRPGLEPASPQVQPRTGDEVPRPHTTSWAAPIPKKLYCFKWQNGISFCGAPGMAEGDRGWGWDRSHGTSGHPNCPRLGSSTMSGSSLALLGGAQGHDSQDCKGFGQPLPSTCLWSGLVGPLASCARPPGLFLAG